MTLDQIAPHRVSSALQRTWTAKIPACVAGGAILLPAVLLNWPYTWILTAMAIVAYIATDAGMAKLRQHFRIKEAMTPPRTFPESPKTHIAQRAERWADILGDNSIRSFVLFSYGTCVVSVDADHDPAAQAKHLLQQFGHSIPGTPSADMLVYTLPDTGDFVIGGYHPNILTFVSRDMFPPDTSVEELQTVAGLCGRRFRVLDTFALDVVHTHVMNRVRE